MQYSLNDLIIAYKKVKCDIYYDQSNISILKIVDFEEHLKENLELLLSQLNDENYDYFSSREFLGGFNLSLKSVKFLQKEENSIYFSNQFKDLSKQKLEKIEYRYIGDVSIEFQIIGSLWIDKVGTFLEQNISKNSY